MGVRNPLGCSNDAKYSKPENVGRPMKWNPIDLPDRWRQRPKCSLQCHRAIQDGRAWQTPTRVSTGTHKFVMIEKSASSSTMENIALQVFRSTFSMRLTARRH